MSNIGLYSFLCSVTNKLLEIVSKKENIITPTASTTIVNVATATVPQKQESVPKITVTIPSEPSVPNNTPYGSYCPNSFLGVPREDTRDKVLASCVPEETTHDHRGIYEPY